MSAVIGPDGRFLCTPECFTLDVDTGREQTAERLERAADRMAAVAARILRNRNLSGGSCPLSPSLAHIVQITRGIARSSASIHTRR